MKKQIKTTDNKKGNGRKNGRPFAITKEKEEILIKLLSDGVSQHKAAVYIGVNEKTIIEHKDRFPEFMERLEKANLETHKLAHKSIKVGMLKDWRAGAWWLERTEPERFKEKKEVELTKPSLVDDMFDED
jgi:transposase